MRMAYPVPENWTICGALNKSGIPFSDGKVYAYCQASSGFIKIAESGISADGTFSLTFSRWNFQQGDESLEYPALIGRDKEKTVLARTLGSKSQRMNGIVESMFYFTVPRNDVLFSYWDTIADRLYKSATA